MESMELVKTKNRSGGGYKVSAIIPTYNRSSQISACIASVLNSSFKDLEIIVVDNASTEDIKSIAEQFSSSRIKYVRLPRNMMAAGGRNAGIKRARGEYLLFIDSDNIVDEFMIENLVKAADSDSSIGMVGPLMLYYKSKERVWFSGNSMSLLTSRVSFFDKDFDRVKTDAVRLYETHHLPNLMMVKRSVQRKAGLFDQAYYIMFEEADYAVRVKEAGYKVMLCYDAVTYHDCLLPEQSNNELRQLGCETPQRAFHFAKNRNLFMLKYAPWYGKILYFMFFRFCYAFYYCAKALKNHRTDIAKAYMKGVFYKRKAALRRGV